MSAKPATARGGTTAMSSRDSSNGLNAVHVMAGVTPAPPRTETRCEVLPVPGLQPADHQPENSGVETARARRQRHHHTHHRVQQLRTEERRQQLSNLPGNPHAELAEADIEYPGAWNELEAVTALLQTSARATLALAYEQRTATLVQALLSDSLVTDGKYDEIQAEVRKRLGLGDNNE